MAKIRVFFVDDSQDLRDLYCRWINRQEEMECVGTKDSAIGIEEAIEELRVNVAVVDLNLPGRDALEAVRGIAARCPWCRVVIFSGYDDSKTRSLVLQAGAYALVSKHDDPMSLIREIVRVHTI